jgi:hypothetical protein
MVSSAAPWSESQSSEANKCNTSRSTHGTLYPAPSNNAPPTSRPSPPGSSHEKAPAPTGAEANSQARSYPPDSNQYYYHRNHSYRNAGGRSYPPPPAMVVTSALSYPQPAGPMSYPPMYVPSSHTAGGASYRFETPSYVYGIPPSLHLPASAGCTCKKSRYVAFARIVLRLLLSHVPSRSI